MKIWILAATLLCSSLSATIILNDVMNPMEQKKTGVASLNALQKAELEAWINRTFVLKTQMTPATQLSLSENLNNGKKIQLTDGSVYEIAAQDVTITSFWITPVPVVVVPNKDANYPFRLINQTTGESVRAKLVS